ncbi:hypothetical protein [Okeania sp. SIO2C2]|nr:hypothetical protein [Okeania sp. SIO2C2]
MRPRVGGRRKGMRTNRGNMGKKIFLSKVHHRYNHKELMALHSDE